MSLEKEENGGVDRKFDNEGGAWGREMKPEEGEGGEMKVRKMLHKINKEEEGRRGGGRREGIPPTIDGGIKL
jgi:hypothetical protein